MKMIDFFYFNFCPYLQYNFLRLSVYVLTKVSGFMQSNMV